MRQIWETVRPASKFKSEVTENKYQKEAVMSLVKEGIKQMFNAKTRKTEKVHATEKKKNHDSDFDIEDFFKDLSESDNNE
jgi:hypothetical protein